MTAAKKEVVHIYTALQAVQKALGEQGISKDQTNKFSKYKFRGIDDVQAALAPLLAEHNLLIMPSCVDVTMTDRETKNGDVQIHTLVKMYYTFLSTIDGSHYEVQAYGEAMDKGDKSVAQADSAAYKNCIFKTFCVPVEGQNDSDEKTPEPSAAQAPRQIEFITKDQAAHIGMLCADAGLDVPEFIKWLTKGEAHSIEAIPAKLNAKAVRALGKRISEKAEKYAEEQSATAKTEAAEKTHESVSKQLGEPEVFDDDIPF